MVHALERARWHLRPDGTLILIQPHQQKRIFVSIVAARKREPVSWLINPVFQPLINAANAAIETVVQKDLFAHIATSHHRYRVRLANPAELHRYLHLGQRPPRFPPGGRQRLHTLWKQRSPGARIEVTEFMTMIVLRAN